MVDKTQPRHDWFAQATYRFDSTPMRQLSDSAEWRPRLGLDNVGVMRAAAWGKHNEKTRSPGLRFVKRKQRFSCGKTYYEAHWLAGKKDSATRTLWQHHVEKTKRRRYEDQQRKPERARR